MGWTLIKLFFIKSTVKNKNYNFFEIYAEKKIGILIYYILPTRSPVPLPKKKYIYIYDIYIEREIESSMYLIDNFTLIF